MGQLRWVVWGLSVFVLACGSPAAPVGSDAGGSSSNTFAAATTGNVGWVVSSTDDRGTPRFLWGTTQWVPPPNAPNAVLAQLGHVSAAYSASDAALATLSTVRTIALPSGASVTTLRHEIHGVEVFGSDVSVLLRDDNSLVAISGAPHPGAVRGLRATFSLAIDAGVGEALASMTGERVTARDRQVASGRWSTFELVHPRVTASAPVRARAVYFADGARLQPAYLVEAMWSPTGTNQAQAARRVIAADTGAVLYSQSLTANDAFTYRVWANAQNNPNDDPYADMSPHPTGNPDATQPSATAASLVSMEAFNTNPSSLVDPWLAANATQTQGNNVDAYSDRVAPDGFTAGSDFRPTTTATRTFDYTYDLTQSALANQNQARAGIVHAFYVTNWLHDYWYDAGFDEAAGNAQLDNFGRGGSGGDRMLVEVQDNADSERDNANMSTPGDGQSPKMQIYVWSPQETRTVTLNPGNTTHIGGSAAYGPQTFDVTDTVVALVDNTAPAFDGCNTVTNAVALSGNIALIDRGNCDFIDKTRAAQSAGAVGVIIVDNTAGATPPLMGGSGGQPITIPTLSVTKAAGDALRAQIASQTVTARLRRTGGPLREGALDSTVVAHEWGHYLHHRLVGGCSNQQCAALSEGWGDFVALHMQSRSTDDLGATYAVAGHAGAQDLNSWYWGIRRTPYTTNMTKNPLTFRHIGDGQALPTGPSYNIFAQQNSEVHNAGEIWAQMMYEAYRRVRLAPNGRTFEQVRQDVASYVVAGLALTPADATFTEQRDAVLAAAAAVSATDFANMAAGFAARGAGTCAVSPPRTSVTLDGVVEAFTLAPSASIGSVGLDDALISCDNDGFLDGQERGYVSIDVANTGPIALSDGQLSISSGTSGVTFPSGSSVVVPSVAPMGKVTVKVPIELAASFPQQGPVALTITVTSASACTTTTTKSVNVGANRDETPTSTATDSVESVVLAWTATGTNASKVWSRTELSATQHAYLGIALGGVTDTQLMSPSLAVGSGAMSMTFRHRFQFETSQGKNWDGGVIEVSQDNGTTWVDANTLAAVPYGGTIVNTSGNPLMNRQAFVKSSAGYPAFANVTINFGTSLANKTIRVRFRIGTDQAVGTAGWTIDDIGFTGLTNTPFTTVSNDAGVCNPPGTDAGIDAPLPPDATVVIDAAVDAAIPDAMVDAMVDAPVPDAPPPDAATMIDAAVPDAAVPDAAVPDAAIADAAMNDGAPMIDAPPADARPDGPGKPPPPPDDGCCSAGGVQPGKHAPLVIVMGLLLLRRRRRR